MIEERGGQRCIIEEITINAPIERVFTALVSATDLAKWWTEPGVCDATEWSIDARVGGKWISRWAWVDGDTFAIGGTILDLQAPHRLVYDWWDDRYPGMPRTVVSYDLTAIEARTHLRVTHEGFDGERSDLADYGGGWKRVLTKVSAFVSNPRT